MSPVHAASAETHLRAVLEARPDGIVEAIARDVGLASRDVLAALGPAAVFVDARRFHEVWSSLHAWPEVMLIVNTEHFVLEAKGSLPLGSDGAGWFNIHGDGPIGGHLRRDAIAEIALVDRMFHGRRSCSVWFLDGKGEAIFKVFVPRAADRSLMPDQLAAFEDLRSTLA